MNQIFNLTLMQSMQSTKEKVDEKYNEIRPLFTDSELSHLIFKNHIDQNNKELISAHIQSIKKQLDRLYSEKNFKEEIFLEFSKSITLFDHYTKALQLDAGTFGDQFIRSRYFYLDAIRSCKVGIQNFHQGSMEFACIPIKLRLAIEIYFKNMIGYISSSQEFLSGNRKGQTSLYPLSISDLLNFFSHKKYKKYCELPINIEIIKDINFWSNSLVHTGIINFAWQNLEAIQLLGPLFNPMHEDDHIHIEGFNYLSPKFSQDDLEKDLNTFLTNSSRKVKIKLSLISEKPFEGSFYYPRSITSKCK